MIRKKNKSKESSRSVSIYASRYDLHDFILTKFNEFGMPSRVAKQLIQDELKADGIPILNLASFVTTWMEPEADELIMQCINKNFIDHDEYPRIEKIHERCVHILADLLNVKKSDNYAGTATVGSSEAIMLAGLAHKFSWRNKQKAAGMDSSQPNIIIGADVQICWDKFARYFDVEPRIIPLQEGKYVITAKDVEPLIDENTICVAAVLGTTFTGEYDEIEEINALLVRIKKEKSLDIPLHVDAASGGFISMFIDDGINWDFRLEQVKSINLSGHKYGLVYPGIGWLIFRDESVVPSDLIFDVNYLGGNMPTYTLNFSNGCSMIVAQYYNFLRLGKIGYQKIINNMMEVSDFVLEGLLSTGKFVLLGTRRMEPVVSVSLKDNSHYSVFDISRELRTRGWIVPAYTLPANAQNVEALRIVIKENISLTLAHDFLNEVKTVLTELEGKESKFSQPRRGKNITH
ncbi:glutamate decarboxylase [Legionella fallonii]|uniref:Glutamate decarboxylase n=1 Tax=Legionella fallonii LLAP-10 TaxID=1212491 RepID=A0A098G827_9GAMM|nr:glutamate decarboxylase [Legionella fallonii]CEG58623.1 Glutamate decarboxylase [Legionella fallonii LLAP-10]